MALLAAASLAVALQAAAVHPGEAYAQVAAPVVTGVDSPTLDGVYGTGYIVGVRVAFTENVDVAGTPLLEISTDPPRNASYGVGSGTDRLVFWYAVQPGDTAARLGYAGQNAISLNGGSINGSASGLAANVSLPESGVVTSTRGDPRNIEVYAFPRPALVPAGSAVNGSGGFDLLHKSQDVSVFKMGDDEKTYALVSSNGDNQVEGVQLIRIHENGTLEAVNSVTGSNTEGANRPFKLEGPDRNTVFNLGGNIQALVTSWSDGVQGIRILPDGTLLPNGTATYSPHNGARDADTFVMGDKTYAVVTWGRPPGAVQLIEVHPNGTLAAVGSPALGGASGYKLSDVRDIDAFVMNGTAYAIAAARNDNATQLIRINSNGSFSLAGSAVDGELGSDGIKRYEELQRSKAVSAFETNGTTYALVGSGDWRPGFNYGIQLIRIHADGNLSAADSVPDDRRYGFRELRNPYDIDTFVMNGTTYAIVSARDDRGVQLIRINPGGTLTAAGWVTDDDETGFTVLEGASGIDVFELGGVRHAIVSAYWNHGVQLIRLTPAYVVNVTSPSEDRTYVAGETINITVAFSENVTIRDPPPRLVLGTGGTAEYVSGRGTDALTFVYRVVPNDIVGGLDYAGQGALQTRGGLTGAGIHEVDLTLPAPGGPGSLANSSNIVLNATVPTVLRVGAPAGTYTTGDMVNITVTFSKDVSVTGVPLLELETGTVNRNATYFDGNNTSMLVFNYTVVDGDSATRLDYAGTGALSLNNGTIRDAAGSSATLALPAPGTAGSLADSGRVRIVTATVPVVLSVGSPDNDGTYGTGRILAVNVNFSEAVNVTGTPALALSTEPARNAIYKSGNGTGSLVFWYAVQRGDAAARLDYAGTGALSLNGGTIRGEDDNANLTLPAPGSADSLGALKAIEIKAAQRPVLVPAGSATDGAGGFDALAGSQGVSALPFGGSVYAVVAANNDDGVQLVRIHENGTLEAAGSAAGAGDDPARTFRLEGPQNIVAFRHGGGSSGSPAHALATTWVEGVQGMRIHPDGTLSPAGSAPSGSAAHFGPLHGSTGIDTVEVGGETYAVVGLAGDDRGIQTFLVGPDGTLAPASAAPFGNPLNVEGDRRDIAAFYMGGDAYAVSAARSDDGVRLAGIGADGVLSLGASATDGAGGFNMLGGASGIDAFEMGGDAYAVAAARDDNGVQLIRIHGDGTISPGGSAGDGEDGFAELGGAYGIDAFEMGGHAYALVAARDDNGVQLVRVNNDGTLTAAGWATDDRGGFDMLGGASGVDTFGMGCDTYAIVASSHDHGVQLIRLSPAYVTGVITPPGDRTYAAGDTVEITVAFSEAVGIAGPPPRLLLGAGGAGIAEYASGGGTAMLKFRYTVAPGSGAADLVYAGPDALQTRGAITGAGGHAANLELPWAGDGPPGSRIAATADAEFTGRNTVRIEYSAPLGVPAACSGPVYSAVTASGETSAMPVAGVSGLDTSTHIVVFGGDGVTENQTGAVALKMGLEGEANGTLYEFTNDTIAVMAAGAAAAVSKPTGQMPVVEITPDSFVREIDVEEGGAVVRAAINITALGMAPPAPDPADNVAVFPPKGLTIRSSFAVLTVPPGATAMFVPADGLLELYVSGPQPLDERPLIERVADALNASAADIELRRVIEVGDNETHVVFDMPVRILLNGQANGTAYYVNNTNNAVMPITAACAADDTAAVHTQLGGAGECQLDLGGDKAIYTYHLTEFSTAKSTARNATMNATMPDVPRPPTMPDVPRPPTALEIMVGEAAAGSTVEVPAGTYAADMLTVNKSLTIEPADPDNPPLFTNHTHIVVRPAADGPVVIRGLVFEDTTHSSDGRGLASIIVETAAGMPPGGAVTIEGNTFRNTCDTAVRAAAGAGDAPPIAGLVIRDNKFYDVGGNREGAGCASSPNAPDRADAIAAGRHAAPFAAGAAQLANMTVQDNYIFGTTYTGIRIAGADGLVVEGNHIEDVPDDGIRILPSRDVAVRANTIVGANSAPYAQAASAGAGAAVEVWSGSDDVAATLNRISGSAGAFYVCAGTCDPGPDAADGTGGAQVSVPRAAINSDDGSNDVRFNHNVLAKSNTGTLIANGAGGMLNARSNYYPGYAASAEARVAAAAGSVTYAPALDDAGPVRIGAVVADGDGSPVRSIDSAVRAAFELGVHGFNAGQAEIGGFVGLEPAVRAVDSPGSTAAARAGHAAAIADLRSGASADARMLPVLHNSIASAMAAYDASGAAALAGISAMGATHGHYPFVNARNGTIVAHGANASLVGDTATVRALAGGTAESVRALFDFENMAGIAGTGVAPGYPNASWKWWAYDFVDPATGGTVSKRSVLALHPGPDGALHGADDLVFGAGYYPGPGAAHLVVAAGDAPAAANASAGAVVVSPASTAAQLAAPDLLFRLAPPDSKLAGAVLQQAAADGPDAASVAVVALNDSASLQSMGLAGELAKISDLDALPDGVSSVRVVSYDSSAADGWESSAASSIRAVLPQGSAAVYAGRADAFAALAAAFGDQLPSNTRWYATGELARADLAAAGPAAAALARAVNLTVLSQHAAPDAAIDAALALPSINVTLDETTRGPAYAAYDAPGLLGRAIASTAAVPGSPAGVAAAIEEDVARTHDGALGSPLILDRNGDLALPVTYAVSSFPGSAGGAWAAQPNRVGELSCGITLERAVLDFGNLAPGQRSRVAPQTVINTGTIAYDTVRLAPTDWAYAGTGETLPASITELRELGRTAAFLDARPGIQVAQGLGPGMDRDIQYRIDLTAYQAIPAGEVSQTITYLVMCADAP